MSPLQKLTHYYYVLLCAFDGSGTLETTIPTVRYGTEWARIPTARSGGTGCTMPYRAAPYKALKKTIRDVMGATVCLRYICMVEEHPKSGRHSHSPSNPLSLLLPKYVSTNNINSIGSTTLLECEIQNGKRLEYTGDGGGGVGGITAITAFLLAQPLCSTCWSSSPAWRRNLICRS